MENFFYLLYMVGWHAKRDFGTEGVKYLAYVSYDIKMSPLGSAGRLLALQRGFRDATIYFGGFKVMAYAYGPDAEDLVLSPQDWEEMSAREKVIL